MSEKAVLRQEVKNAAVYPLHEKGYRFAGVVCAFWLLASLALVAVSIRDNVVKAQFDKLMQAVYRISANHGMYVEDVIVEGNKRTPYEELIEALNLCDNESILGVDIAKLQSRIEQLVWVKDCVVKRSFFPNNILVKINERKVRALWEYEGRYYPVDEEGNVIETEDFEPEGPILILGGEGAPHHLAELLKTFLIDEELAGRVKAAVFVSNRRWNLIFDNTDNGIVVKLPEKDYAEAYKKISLLNKRQGIFKRKLTSFDLRYKNKIIVDIDKSVEDLMLKR